MEQESSVELQRIKAYRAAVQTEIAKIMADTERRIAPLRARDDRYAIAEDVLREVAADKDPLDIDHPDEDTSLMSRPMPKAPARSLIVEEFAKAGVPLSKKEMFDRLSANGHDLSETTIGSTLSRMVSEGVLVRAENNKYQMKPGDETPADQQEGGGDPPP